MKFSQRIGKKPFGKALQLNSMDDELRIGLWNVYTSGLVSKIPGYRGADNRSRLDNYFDHLWHEYYKKAVDTRSSYHESNIEQIREDYFNCEWEEVYDFLEFNSSWEIQVLTGVNVFAIRDLFNKVLEREFSGYRFIEDKIVPISNQIEIEEVNEALKVGVGVFHSPYRGVNVHLKLALEKLSDKKAPDFRNSIKESISAVETLCRILTSESTLGEALKAFEKKGIKLNAQFKLGIEKFYAYSNSKESGIRHAIVETPNLPGFEEAKFMLVTCCAFINFLISKNK